MINALVAGTIAVLVMGSSAVAQEGRLEITLKNNTAKERAAREQLLRITQRHDLTPFLFTRKILIDENEPIPHSHPVLTLNADTAQDDVLLSTFVHEQLHWRVDEANDRRAKAALQEFRTIYPDAPDRRGGGARDQFSTYLHLIVCDLEYQALTELLGAAHARRLLAASTHYRWIYQRVLEDRRVREVNRKHGFVVRTGAPVPPVRLSFVPISDDFATARFDYERIWHLEGARMIAAMERISGIRFDRPQYADTSIAVVVFEGASNSGIRERPMMMRASYPEDTRRATLVHELGHRLQEGVVQSEDEHEVLFLWIYDVWIDLWGTEFANEQVAVEKRRGGPYPRAWDAALALSATERAARFRTLRDRSR